MESSRYRADAECPRSDVQRWAQNYPDRPVKLLVSTAPGSGPDILARVLADAWSWMLYRLGGGTRAAEALSPSLQVCEH